MTKIGTICEDYKVPEFEKEFKSAGISFTVESFPAKYVTQLVLITTEGAEQSIIKPIVDRVTQHFIDLKKRQ